MFCDERAFVCAELITRYHDDENCDDDDGDECIC